MKKRSKKASSRKKAKAKGRSPSKALALECNHSDRDFPGILCGYPLPCPFHTSQIALRRGAVEVTLAPSSSDHAASKILDIARRMQTMSVGALVVRPGGR